MFRKGFTLIELLIVVAIIAILAAIAVPNFMEAQVRAKVARTKNDQRTLALAVEAYSVDYNSAPPSVDCSVAYIPNWSAAKLGWIDVTNEASLAGWELRLTSPVAYIGKTPKDPFHTVTGWLDPTSSNPVDKRGRNFTYQYYNWELAYRLSFANGDYNYDEAWVYIGQINMGKPWTATGPRHPARGFRWGFASTGPSLRGNPGEFKWLTWKFSEVSGFYDPTNGTRSFGYILRTNAGEVLNDVKLW